MPAPVVVVGVDGSEAAATALAAAARLAADAGYRIVAVHAEHTPVIATGAPAVGAVAVPDGGELADRCHLDCELVLADTAVMWSFQVRRGDPVTVLVAAADELDAALIVVGRHSPRRRRLLLGSVLARLLSHAHRPVLLVPPPGR